MTAAIRFLEGGTVTDPRGYLAGATYAGINTQRDDKLDLGLLYSSHPCAWAGVYTTNRVKSPSVVYDQGLPQDGKVRGVIVTSGIANTCVGPQGLKDAQEMATLAAKHMGVEANQVVVGTTGVIGVELPMALIRSSVGKIELYEAGGHDLAKAIMTTDTHHKEGAVAFEVGRATVTIGGIAKGAGMIHPDMATMLCFLATDAAVEPQYLHKALRSAVDESFNMLSVDGDTSTNDMVVLLSNGASGISPIREGSREGELFQEALRELCVHLTEQMAADGEGATRVIMVTVEGAASVESARRAARTIVSSNLVKSAVHGGDPNWGRLMAALGRGGAEVEEDKVALYLNDVCLMESGVPIPFHRNAVVSLMRGERVSFLVKLNLGEGKATAWGCDLSEAYVIINSAYTS